MIVVPSIADPRLLTAIADGGLLVLPTDTIYGVVTSAQNQESVARLYRLKARENKPGTVIAADVEQLAALGLSIKDLEQVAHLWPNPVSIVLPAPKNLDYLDQQVGSLAVRIPNDPTIQALLQVTGPLLTSSANHPGESPATTIAEAQRYFGDDVDMYVDGGDHSNLPASTVVRLEPTGQLTVLRQGAVMITEEGKIV